MSELADGHSCPVGSSTHKQVAFSPFSASSASSASIAFLSCLVSSLVEPLLIFGTLPYLHHFEPSPRASSTLPKYAELQPTALARHLVQTASRALQLLPPQGRLFCSTT